MWERGNRGWVADELGLVSEYLPIKGRNEYLPTKSVKGIADREPKEVFADEECNGYLPMKSVTVTKRGAGRVRAGHLWIYRSDVLQTSGAEAGSVVSVRDEHGNFVGEPLFSNRS